MANEIKDLLADFKRLETDIPILKNANRKVVKRLVNKQKQCWANAQYSCHKCLEAVGIPSSEGPSMPNISRSWS